MRRNMIGGNGNTGRKKAGIAIAILIATIILICAWAPWLTEEYGKEKVLSYFNQSYGVDKSDIRIGSVEKKPFEIDFGLYLSPANKSLPETSVRAEVNFYGDVKHEILSAPWFTEENVKEKLREYFSKNVSDKTDIIITSIGMSPIEADISFTFPHTQNYSRGHIDSQVYGHALVTVYGEVKEVKLAALT
jgi:hypothetical protein